MALGCIPRFSPSFSPVELRAATRSLLSPGDEAAAVRTFEQAFATQVGAAHAVMVPSARMGFYLLLKGLGLGPGDEVVLPALTYFAVPAAAALLGCTPVFADVEPDTFNLDPESFRKAITSRTKAVVPTHLFGAPADLGPILDIAKNAGVRVIEDCAQATGARYRKKPVGSYGDAAYATFGLTKNMTTLRGAMVMTRDSGLAERIREEVARSTPLDPRTLWREVATGTAMMLATHRWVYPFTLHPAIRLGQALGKDPIHDRFGEPEARLSTVPDSWWQAGPRAAQAAVGLSQLARLDALNGARIANGRWLDAHLGHTPELRLPRWPADAEPIFMSYVVRHPRREALAKALLARGVDTTIGYMTDASTNPLFSEFPADCPNARESFRTLLHLPVHPNLTQRDLVHLVTAVRHAAYEVDA